MALKTYQLRVVKEFTDYFDALQSAHNNGDQYASLTAFAKVRRGASILPAKTGDGKDLPWVALKMPTGGGKTVTATQILGAAYRRWLTSRNGGGLVLWVVPSDQIYKDTLAALRNPNHFYRESLETISRKIEVWEKTTINRMTPTQLAENLNILLLKLQGANREDKESLKFFRDTGGPITRHFPAEDDFDGHAALYAQIENLEVFENQNNNQTSIKTSLANLMRVCRPFVIIDEGQKAASDLARKTIRGFNPCFVLELSATPPKDVPRLSLVSGQELLDEEMIKLPINVATEVSGKWENCLAKAQSRREELEKKARQLVRHGERFIRPIVLVQVERTGKEQMTPDHIHANHVFEHLTQRLGISADRVKIKSSEQDDLVGVDLMAEDCPVEWIITKSALQEGWDCPFAYILVSLNNTQSITAMTQLVGRVLRQPFTRKTRFDELNESYVYCLHKHPAEIVNGIRTALSKEGYEGDRSSVVDTTSNGSLRAPRVARVKDEFAAEYGEPKPHKILLPRFCLRTEEGHIERFDYYLHSLPTVNWQNLEWEQIRKWDLRNEIEQAKEVFHRIVLHHEALEPLELRALDRYSIEADNRTLAWMVAHLGIDWLSAKKVRGIVERVFEELLYKHGDVLRDKMSLVRFVIGEKLRPWIDEQANKQTKESFHQWFLDERLLFSCEQAAFTSIVPATRPINRKPMMRDDGQFVLNGLFDREEELENELERGVAQGFDTHKDVKWWFRNVALGQGFWIQGWQRNRIYPDFVVRRKDDSDGRLWPCILFFETKGAHLANNEDTEYKEKVAWYFSQIGQIGRIQSWQNVAWRDAEDLGSSAFQKHAFHFEVMTGNRHEAMDTVAKTLDEKRFSKPANLPSK